MWITKNLLEEKPEPMMLEASKLLRERLEQAKCECIRCKAKESKSKSESELFNIYSFYFLLGFSLV
jgi:cytochrome c